MAIVYDQETAGLDHYFGQVLQLGVSVCNNDFNLLEEFNMRSRRQPWVIPAPSAMLITKIGRDTLESGASCYEMACSFNDVARRQDTPIDTYGYNIMSFDDPGLRILFDQNLLQTKFTTHKNENGLRNRRIDIMIMLQALLLHNPSLVVLDTKSKNGASSLKLGVVCRQNGIDLSEGAAHEALADNHGTIGVAKLIKSRAPLLWDHMIGLTTQEGVQNLFDQKSVLHYSEYFFGRPKNRIITGLTQNPSYPAEQIAFDLSVDPASYLSMSSSELMSIMKEKKGNPFIFIRSNKMPVVLPLDLLADGVLPQKTDETVLKARADMMRSHTSFLANVAQAAQKRGEAMSLSKYIEKQIYHPVPEDIEEKIIGWRKAFYHADWRQRGALVGSFKSQFAEELLREPFIARFQKFGQRILFDNAPEFLSSDVHAYLRAAIANRVLSSDGPKELMTIPRALAEIREIRQKFDAGKIDYLASDEGSRITDLENYYHDLKRLYEADNTGHPDLHFETM